MVMQKNHYNYFVKDYDVTESVNCLIKSVREQISETRNILSWTQGYSEAKKDYEKQITCLKEQLEEQSKQIEMLNLSNDMILAKMPTENIKFKAQLHSQLREIVEKIKSKMDNTVDTLINLGDGKEDAIAWFCGILEEILKEYGDEK